MALRLKCLVWLHVAFESLPQEIAAHSYWLNRWNIQPEVQAVTACDSLWQPLQYVISTLKPLLQNPFTSDVFRYCLNISTLIFLCCLLCCNTSHNMVLQPNVSLRQCCSVWKPPFLSHKKNQKKTNGRCGQTQKFLFHPFRRLFSKM